jgi:hypothetical protein
LTTRTLGFALLLLVVVLTGTPAWAHDERISSSSVEVRPHEVLWAVDVGVAGLEKVVRLPAGELELTEAQLQDAKSDIDAYLLECLKVEINGKAVEAEAGALEPVYATVVGSSKQYISYARQHFRFPSSTAVERVQLSSTLFLTILRNHQSALTVTWGGTQKI